MPSKIDEIRGALGRLGGFTYHAADSQDADDIKTVCAALSAIDPEAIRRECAEKICALDAKLPAMRRSSYQEGYGDALDDAEAAVLSAEPAQDDGKPDVVMTMIENSDLSISWECSGCKGIIDDADYVESMEKCPHCGAPIRKFVYIEEAKE